MTASASVESARTADLDSSLIRGIAWTGTVRWASQILSWLSTIVVARLLSPSDYGLVGMATVYLGIILLVNDFGVGAAIIQRKNLVEEDIARLGGLSVGLGFVFFAVSMLVAFPLARFFGEPALRWIVIVSSAGFVAGAFQVLPRSLLARELRFPRLALADGIEALVATAVTLSAAAAGAGYWALVLGPLASRITSAVVLATWRPYRIQAPWPLKSVAGATTFGGHLVVGRLAWYLYSNADFAIVGRILGRVALGAYTVGWTIASIPVDRITAFIGSVTPPIFASVQDNRQALQRYLRLLTEGLALATFPMAIGLALVTDEFVPVVLGEKWRPAIPALRILAFAAAARSISPLLPQVAVAMGYTRKSMERTLLAALTLPLLFLAGTRWGTTGVALGWLIGHPIIVLPLYLSLVLRLIGMKLSSYLAALRPAFILTSLMALAVISTRLVTPVTWSLGASLALHVLVGALAYGLLLLALYRDRARMVYALVRGRRPAGLATRPGQAGVAGIRSS